MCTHAVRSEANQSEILVAPIEHTGKMPLRLKITVVCPRHGVEKMLRRAMLELMAHADQVG